jgi:hypothetical protein
MAKLGTCAAFFLGVVGASSAADAWAVDITHGIIDSGGRITERRLIHDPLSRLPT